MSERTRSVDLLLGDPKRAILTMSIPMIIAMAVQMAYNLIDAVWVAGLGADALAGIGFVFPVYFMIMGLAMGIGVGSSSAIARRIGAEDKRGADSVAAHSLFLVILCSILISIPLFIFAEDIFTLMGAGGAIGPATDYGRVIFGGTIVVMFASVAMALFRAEGDTKRAMYVMLLGSILNIVLDPIFIYGLDMGITGAGVATILAFLMSDIVMVYWLIVKQDTYISITLRGFRPDWPILKDIFSVGLPATVQQMSMAITQLVTNLIILMVATEDGVAIYSTGWRLITVQMVPLFGIASAMTPIAGAAFGSKNYDKIGKAHIYGVQLGALTTIVIGAVFFLGAPWLVQLFTWSESAAGLYDELVDFVLILSVLTPFVTLGILSSSLFQGVGKGTAALIATLFRTVFMTVILTYLLGPVLGYGLNGIWWGLGLANAIGAVVVFIWVRLYLRSLMCEADARCHLSLDDTDRPMG